MRKPFFAYAKTKTQISFAVTAKLISAFVFATRIVQSLNYLNPKFQASSYLLWLYSPVCVGPDRKPRRPVFSQQGSNYILLLIIFLFIFLGCFFLRGRPWSRWHRVGILLEQTIHVLHPTLTAIRGENLGQLFITVW